MKSTRRIARYMVSGVAAMLLAACSMQREPAKQVINDIDNAIDATPEAEQYIPDRVASVKRELADLNASYDKKDYAAVLDGAPAVLVEAKGLAAAAKAKKEQTIAELTTQWTELSGAVPSLLTSEKTRMEALSKSHHLPKGIDLPAAKTALADATVLWAKAQAAFQASHLADAVSAAKDAKSRAQAAGSALKMS